MISITVDDIVSSEAPGRLISLLYRRVATIGEAQFAGAALSFGQWLCLRLVYDGTATTAGAVARETRMTTGAVTRLLDGLEGQNLIERCRSREDRRVVHLKLSSKGERTVLDMAPLLVDSWKGILADFDSEEYVSLINSLSKLLTALDRSVRKVKGEP